MKTPKSSKRGRCLVCDRKVGFFRQLKGSRFCSAEHEQQYIVQLKELGIERLHKAGARLAEVRPADIVLD